MRFAFLSVVAAAGLTLSSGTAAAQHRGVARGHTVTRTQSLTPLVTNNYRAPTTNTFNSSSFQVNPYNAGLLDLSRNYGPNYRGGVVPMSGGFLGTSGNGIVTNGLLTNGLLTNGLVMNGFSANGFSNGNFGTRPTPNYGAFPARRW